MTQQATSCNQIGQLRYHRYPVRGSNTMKLNFETVIHASLDTVCVAFDNPDNLIRAAEPRVLLMVETDQASNKS